MFKYKVDYVEPDCDEYDGGRHYTGDETRLRVFNEKGYELESVTFSESEVADVFDYVEVWEDHAGCGVCDDYAERKRKAGGLDPHTEGEVYDNERALYQTALFQDVQE